MSFWRRLFGRRSNEADKAAEATSGQRQRLLDSPDASDAPAPDPLTLCREEGDDTATPAASGRLGRLIAELRQGGERRNPQPGLSQELLEQVEGLRREGKLREAREALEQLVHLLPQLSALQLALAELDYEGRQLDRALPRLEALTQEPEHALRAHFLLGDHHRREANLLLALRHFEEVLARDVSYPRARARAEDIRARLDRPSGAAAPTILGDRELGASGRYVLQRELGRGGGGTVYLATDSALGRPVAVKLLHPHVARQASARAHLFCEARIAASIQHPQVIAIYDLDEELNLVAMEYCRGGTLAEVVAAGARPPRRALRRLAEMAQVLETVHRAGVVHRDIKPANWLLRGERGTDLAPLVLSDFGIAHAQLEDEEARSEVGLADHFAGSRAYMAPEQRRGTSPDASVDLYASGVVTLALLLGRPPLSPPQALQGLAPLAIDDNLQVLRGLEPRPLGARLEALLSALLAEHVAARPSAEEVVREASALAQAFSETDARRERLVELERRAGAPPRSAAVEAWLQRQREA